MNPFVRAKDTKQLNVVSTFIRTQHAALNAASSRLQCCAVWVLGSLLFACNLGTHETVVVRNSTSISDLLKEEAEIEDEVFTTEPVNVDAPRAKDTPTSLKPSSTAAPVTAETSPGETDPAAREAAAKAAEEAAKAAEAAALAERLRTSAVSSEHRDAFVFFMDGFVRNEKSLMSHILTAPFNLYKVSSLSDSDTTGTLRNALQSNDVNFVIFDESVFPPGTTHSIDLNSPINVQGNKTLLSLHGNIVVRSKPNDVAFNISEKRYVVIRNMIFSSLDNSVPQGTGLGSVIKVTTGSTDVWIDQNKFLYCGSNCIHIEKGSTAQPGKFSISRNIFDSVARGILVEDVQVTNSSGTVVDTSEAGLENIKSAIYDNIFEKVTEFGVQVQNSAYVHLYNNYFKDWGGQAIVTKDRGKLLAESNIFENNLAKGALVESLGCSDVLNNLLLGPVTLKGGNCADNVYHFYTEDEPHTIEDVDGLSGSDLTSYVEKLKESSDAVEVTLLETLGKPK